MLDFQTGVGERGSQRMSDESREAVRRFLAVGGKRPAVQEKVCDESTASVFPDGTVKLLIKYHLKGIRDMVAYGSTSTL